MGDVTHIGLVDQTARELADRIASMPGVVEIRSEAPPYPQVSRQYQSESSVVDVESTQIGGPSVTIIAGPCSVESANQLAVISEHVGRSGAHILRGGAFKPRTSPYSFQGLGEEGLRILADARAATGLPVVTEVVAPDDVELVGTYADMLQIGARNMQNFRLLSEVGAQPKPVLLKRGISSSIEELLLAAEYVASAGNNRVVLCERGIRTFETATRNTFDVSAVPVLKRESHLPVIVDPSHAAGDRALVTPLAAAGVAAGADGVIVEVHHDPDNALSDGPQSLTLEGFDRLVETVESIARAVRPAAPVG